MKKVLIPLALSREALPVYPDSACVRRFEGATMGTTWSVSLVDEGRDLGEIARAIQFELDLVVRQMSTWSPDSDLSRFNQAAAGTWAKLEPAFFTVLDYACHVARDSDGAYDPTVGPLVNLWGFGPEGEAAVPSPQDLAKARAQCGWTKLELDRRGARARQPGGLYVDLSAVAKGYGVDAVARRLRREGLRSYLVEVGGELRGEGVKPDGQPWWVQLEQPLPWPKSRDHVDARQLVAEDVLGAAGQGEQAVDMLLALHGLAVATSGDYQRFFQEEGRHYCHTIDPRTGLPIDNDLASVTVLHPECMVADALATALTVLGPVAGMQWASRRGLMAVFVQRMARGFAQTMTPAFAAMME